MFFLNIKLYFVKTVFFTKMNLAIIQISLPILNDFERVKNHILSLDFVSQNLTYLNLLSSHPLFHKMGFASTSFYDIKKFQFDQVEIDSQLESFSFFCF